MAIDPTVGYSFLLYVLYVVLPLVPAILIFRLFPETKVTVSGPLQNLTVNATGAFAAYVVTVALGFFLVKNVEAQIAFTRHYAVEGVIVDLDQNQILNSDQFYSRYTNDTFNPGGQFLNRDYYFVVVLNHPVQSAETVWIKYWDLTTPAGIGTPPAPVSIPLELLPTSSLQRFRLHNQGGRVVVVPETQARSASSQSIETAMEGHR